MDVKKQDLNKTSYEPPPGQTKPVPPPQDIPPPIEPEPLPEEPDWPQLPFGPPDPAAVYGALKELYAERPFSTRFHSQTGLPAYLVGELQAAQDASPIDAAEAFLKENEMALLGHEDGAWIEHTHEATWDDGTSQLSFNQTNQAGVPLYGSSVACSYVGDELVAVSSTLYPALPEEINDLEWDEPTWLDDKSIAKLRLPDEIQPVRFEAPRDQRQEKGRADRWILPYAAYQETDLPPEGGSGTYRPVWRVVVVDIYDKGWLVLVDAATLEVLYWEPTWVQASVEADLYETPQAALQGSAGLTRKTLDYGAGADMAHADHVHVSGDKFVEPGTAADQKLRHLSATTFFHVRKIQEDQTLLGGLSSLSSVGTPAFPNPRQDIKVELKEETGSAEYDDHTGTIILYYEDQNSPWPVNRPGYDCEVIYHEFVHALDRYVNPPLFKGTSYKQRSCTKAIDEGVAFYFACVLGEDAHWAEYAYQHWKDNGTPFRHLVAGPTTPALVLHEDNKDPDTDKTNAFKAHAIGTWWARLFWALRDPGQLGPEACDRLLLRTVRALAPVEEPSDFAALLEGLGKNNAEKTKIRAMATQFEVSTLHYKNGGTPYVQ